MFHFWQQTICILSLGWRSPDINLARSRKQCEGGLIRPNDRLPSLHSPGFMTSAPHSPLSGILITESGYGIAAHPEIPCSWSSLRTVLVLAGFVSVTFSSAVTFADVVFLFFVTILRNVHLSRSHKTHFCPCWYLSDAIFSVLLCVAIILDTVPREAPETSATLVMEAPTIHSPTICPRSNSVSSNMIQ
ncbi:hypothetical protein B7P43_G14781 [Cryptotermes secundus]|uniref:Uncharacterized protein n=1 Tax=Cryptotermes secundus TaxID=105785 RepID=A0A2J7QIV7_9NEOP|nr:hypothetical protein B7P43_G14781 [Cryptotermes secundus]